MWKNIKKLLFLDPVTLWIMVLISILILFFFLKVNTNDFWWLLALGRNFWETKAISNYDFLSYTAPNGFFWNHSRLFDIIIYWLYEHGRWISLQVFMMSIIGFAYWLLYKTISLKPHYKLITLTAILLTFIPLSGRLLYRPELMSLLFTAVFIFILYKYKYQNSKLIWLIPLLQLLWANSHAGFVYGLALTGIFLLSAGIRSLVDHKKNILKIFTNKQTRILTFVFLLSLLACLLTSYGLTIITLVYSLMQNQEAKQNIAEWVPYSWKQLLTIANPVAILILSTILLLIRRVFILPKPIKIKHLPWEDIFLFILYFYSLITHVRFIHLSSMIIALILARVAIYTLPKKIVVRRWWPHALLAIFTLVILTSIKDREFGLEPLLSREPVQAVKFIKDQEIPGNMINEYSDGGYLDFNLYPLKQTFIDGRTPNLYDNDFFWRVMKLKDKNIRDQMIEKYDVNFWLWPRDNDTHMILWEDPKWKLIYFDDVSTIYLKNDPKNQELIDKFAYNYFSPNADQKSIEKMCTTNQEGDLDLKNKFIAELKKGLEINPNNWLHLKHLASIYQLCDFQETDLPLVKNYLYQALKLNPSNKDLLQQIGYVHLQEKNYKAAASFFKKAGEDVPSLIGLATAQYNLGDYKSALKNLLKARDTRIEIQDDKYYQTLGRVYYSLDKDDLAIEFYHRYQDLTLDYSAESYTDLAQAYYYDGQMDKAQENLEKALEQDPNYQIALELKNIMGL